MTMTVGAIPNLRIAGAANAWPGDLLGKSAQLSNEEAYKRLLGHDWQRILDEKNWDPEKTAQTYGVNARGWTKGTAIGSLELGISAAEQALARAGINANQLNAIFVATCTPHQITSTLAGKIAKHFHSDAAAIDIRAGGAGGLNSLATAALYHAHGCKASLIICAETSSKYVGDHDLANGLLFGDGASAIVLVTDSDAGERGLIGAVIGNADWKGRAFTVPGRLPPEPDTDPAEYFFQTPDSTYRACLADTWKNAAARLRSSFPEQCRRMAAILPYAVTKDQVLAAAAPFDASCEVSLNLLAEHGCIGCASPIASLVDYWNQHCATGETSTGALVGSLAVAGGISWSGLLWQL